MIIGACFFGFYSTIFFIGALGSNSTGILGPATATGILTFIFIMLARSPKTERHIGKLSKPVFVLLCIIATIICGCIITRLTNQNTRQPRSENSVISEPVDQVQSGNTQQGQK